MISVLVCGGRDWDGEVAVESVLNAIDLQFGIGLVIHGAASGADTMAMQWANRRGIPHKPFPANWPLHGLNAGRKRNREMAKERPDLAIAFPGGSGTEDMVQVALRSKIPLIRFGGFQLM